ncbi:MAG: selenocysteine-specific translation elongation factor [Anaerolineales bacterium]|nr:selenocysteine-specific translation elongation factor [Anaerolineales bacterium]
MHVIGTAGHVDHGKSTLIAALTGTHPDRLKEEQEREMTIELGFGWLTLPDGEEIGIVDVPGHRDFIENMLAGIAGIDAALLVIAADEGVMPQTKEHLAILDLLQIPAGLVALTKTDLAPDPEWLALVETDIRATLTGTVMAGAPIIRVSARAKTGLDELLSTLTQILGEKTARLDLGRPRLPIDRVFSMPGFGTVVTGTLSDGHLALGDEVIVLPSGHKGRVRGLQTHKKKEERAVPGSRTAVNISGIAVEQVMRGEVVTQPGQYQPTRRVDARIRLLKDISQPLKHATEVKVFVGATETMAALRLLGTEALKPGEEGWVQLELRDPIVAVRGDRYILRRPSPGETLGGGVIIDHQPKGRHKRFDEKVLKSLAALAAGSPADILLEAALALNAAPMKELTSRSRLEAEPAEDALKENLENSQLLQLEDGNLTITSDLLVIAAPHWNVLRDKAVQMVQAYHKNFPLRRGIPREELKSRLKLQPRVFNALVKKLVAENTIVEAANALAIPGHEITFDSGQQAKVQGLMRRFAQNPYSPPSVKECQAEVGEEILNALVELGQLKQLTPDVIFRTEDYDQMVAKVRAFIGEKGQMTVADARDLFDSSRKYMLALLEHLDATSVTIRDGDFRKLRK